MWANSRTGAIYRIEFEYFPSTIRIIPIAGRLKGNASISLWQLRPSHNVNPLKLLLLTTPHKVLSLSVHHYVQRGAMQRKVARQPQLRPNIMLIGHRTLNRSLGGSAPNVPRPRFADGQRRLGGVHYSLTSTRFRRLEFNDIGGSNEVKLKNRSTHAVRARGTKRRVFYGSRLSPLFRRLRRRQREWTGNGNSPDNTLRNLFKAR